MGPFHHGSKYLRKTKIWIQSVRVQLWRRRLYSPQRLPVLTSAEDVSEDFGDGFVDGAPIENILRWPLGLELPSLLSPLLGRLFSLLLMYHCFHHYFVSILDFQFHYSALPRSTDLPLALTLPNIWLLRLHVQGNGTLFGAISEMWG